MQHARGITNTPGVQSHLDDLLLDRRRLSSIGILEEKGPSTSLKAGTAAIALLVFRRQPMLDNISLVTIGTVQPLGHHHPPHSDWDISSSVTRVAYPQL